MNSNAGLERLRDTWRQLQGQWQRASDLWVDIVRSRFEGEYWVPLEREIPHTIQEFEHIARVIAQAHQSVR